MAEKRSKKNTIIMVVLIGILMVAYVAIGQIMKDKEAETASPPVASSVTPSPTQSAAPVLPTVTLAPTSSLLQEEIPSEKITRSTDLFDITFDTRGGSIGSLKLKKFKHQGDELEMILGAEENKWNAFLLYFNKDNAGEPFYGPFTFADKGSGVYEFGARANFADKAGAIKPVNIIKTYTFLPGEYLFSLKVTLANPEGSALPFNYDGYAYALETAPQIGPMFAKLNRRDYFRHYTYFNGSKRQEAKIDKSRGQAVVDERVSWAGIDDKYFAFIGAPDASSYRQLWTEKPVAGLVKGSQLSFVRSTILTAAQTDSYYFYVGPKEERTLQRYNSVKSNAFNVSELRLDRVMDTSFFLWRFFEFILKYLLIGVHMVIPNWGWAIIVMTIIVKLILFPLSLRGLLSTARMTELQPKIQELQEKYKGKPQELQRAQMEFYKKNGVSPLGGCAPMAIQFPILIGLYNLFYKYFDFRGAPWIGWIRDLSAPESIYAFTVDIPFVHWTDLRALPIIYLASQLLMTKFTQTGSAGNATTGSGKQMKMMMWAFPIVFFFVLYDMPSGLLLYWICSNLLSLIQQLVINYLKKSGRIKPKNLSDKKKKESRFVRMVKEGNKFTPRGKNK